jgi:NAD(P)-dependent dehydrogenase (short-subunit alcohol dehydrogenase family)
MATENGSEVVVVTGASAGLGRAIVQRFARDKARIGLVARGKKGLEGARRDVEAAGGKALVVTTDVADPDQVEQAAAAVERELGPIDIWINDAMVSVFSPVKEMSPAEYKHVTEVTYLGYVYGTLAALKRMLPRDHGTIVQVGSALAYRGIPLQSAYCGSKHAIQGFTESLRCELLHDNSKVWVTMVQMPAMNTPQFDWVKSRLPRRPQPVPPIYQPEVGAEAVHYAAHHRRREIYVGYSTVVAIVGNKVAPGLDDHYLARTGFDSQQFDGAADPSRPCNLYTPVDEDRDFGAHGDFDAPASSQSVQLWTDLQRDWLMAAGLGVAAFALGALVWKGRRQSGAAEPPNRMLGHTMHGRSARAPRSPSAP